MLKSIFMFALLREKQIKKKYLFRSVRERNSFLNRVYNHLKILNDSNNLILSLFVVSKLLGSHIL